MISDHDMLRFLWHFNKNLPVDTYHMNVHLFGKTDSASCFNWALRKTALDNCEKFNVYVVNAVLNKFYMDIFLDSYDNLEAAIIAIHDMICSGFELAIHNLQFAKRFCIFSKNWNLLKSDTS